MIPINFEVRLFSDCSYHMHSFITNTASFLCHLLWWATYMSTRWHLQNWLYVKQLTIYAYIACYRRSDLYQQRKPDNWYLEWQIGSQTSIIQHAESLIFDNPSYIKDVQIDRSIRRRTFDQNQLIYFIRCRKYWN